jgi:hypothetical protein
MEEADQMFAEPKFGTRKDTLAGEILRAADCVGEQHQEFVAALTSR